VKERERSGFGIIGVGAAACAVCCAGPLLAVLGGLSVAGLAAMLVVGGIGLVIAVSAAAAFVIVHRRRERCVASDRTLPVAPPRSRSPHTVEVP
jgi:hypothetical protein